MDQVAMTREELARKIVNKILSSAWPSSKEGLASLILPLLPEGAETFQVDRNSPLELKISRFATQLNERSNFAYTHCEQIAKEAAQWFAPSPMKEEGTPQDHDYALGKPVPIAHEAAKEFISELGGIQPQEGGDASDTRTNSYGRTATPASGGHVSDPLAAKERYHSDSCKCDCHAPDSNECQYCLSMMLLDTDERVSALTAERDRLQIDLQREKIPLPQEFIDQLRNALALPDDRIWFGTGLLAAAEVKVKRIETLELSLRSTREALRKLAEWDKRHPKNYVMNEGQLLESEKELDEICAEAAALSAPEGRDGG